MGQIDYDILVRAGRVFCSETGLDGPGAVAIEGDRIAASGADVPGGARQVLDFPDALLLPGFVDMHAHPGPEGWKYAMDPDRHMLPRGTTTILSQGDPGAATWDDYQRNVIEGSRIRVRVAISPSIIGESTPAPVLGDLDNLDVDACVGAIRRGGEHIWGIAVNAPGAAAHVVMERVLAIAERTGKPLLFGIRGEPTVWPIADQLKQLRRGDVVTYSFHAQPESIVSEGRVIDAAWEARERGVLFDIGHGMASLNFEVAETAISQGFFPDTISTDFYRRHLGADPPHDMGRTLSKLLAVGMPETDALARTTARPADALGMSGEVGTLAPGSCADLALLRWNDDAAPLVDVAGNTRPGGCWEPILTVRAGQIVPPAQ